MDPHFVSIEDSSPEKHHSTPLIIYQPLRQHVELASRYALEEYRDQPLYQLMVKLGKTFPKPLSDTPQIPGEITTIEGGIVNFHVFSKVAPIEIEWVENLGQHLEFDEGSRKLKLFKYPSVCFKYVKAPNSSTR